MGARPGSIISDRTQPRVRRATDVTAVLIGGVLLAWAVVNRGRVGALSAALDGLVATLPSWADEPLSVIYSLAFVAAVGALGLLLVRGRHHLDALLDVVLTLLVTAAVTVVMVRVFNDAWPYVLPELGLDQPERQTPVLRIAVTTAVLAAAGPHLAQPLRRLGWTLVGASALAGSGLGFGVPSDALGAVGLGVLAAGAVRLVRGSPAGLPDLATVATALERLGLTVVDLQLPASRSWGARPVHGRLPDGRPVLITALGRDAADQQLLERLARRVLEREPRAATPTSRLGQAQQEALVLLWADRAGIAVPELLGVGTADDDLVLLVQTDEGTRLAELAPDADGGHLDDRRLTAVWADLARLHAAGMSHGELSTRAVRLDGATHRLTGFAAGSLTAGPGDRARDVVGLLVTLTDQVGAARAVGTARRGLGDPALVAALPYLQVPALPPSARRLLDDASATVDTARGELAAQLGCELPEPVALHRVSWRTLLLAVLGVVAATTLLPALAGIDLAAAGRELAVASWGLLLAALLMGQLAYVSEAAGMLAATPARLPFRPLVVLQVGARFLGVATPGPTGRIAANAAFLSRFGVSPTASLTQGSLDALAGMLVEAAVLALTLGFSDLELDLDLDVDVAVGRVLLAVAVVVVVAALLVARVPALRTRLVPVLEAARDAARQVLARPSRAVGLLTANLATRVVNGLVLWLALRAVGVELGVGVVLVVVIAAGLVQGLVPVPGGVGVTEAVLTLLLVLLGAPETAAFAAVVAHRAITFYLPVLQGAVALVWLRRAELV